MQTKHSKRKHTNKNMKSRRNKKRRTMKMNMNMKGGSPQVCDELSSLGNNNIFNIFKSSVQLPKIMIH